jgi:hypothetical protein
MRGGFTLALTLVAALAACSGGGREPTPSAAPAPAASSAPAARFSSFATPCPTVGDRAGTKLDSSLDTPISSIVECSYGDRAKFPHVNSLSTINKAGNPKGAPDQITQEMFEALRGKAKADAAGGVSAEERPGLGDEAFVVVSYKDNVTVMVVRSANALIQASLTVDADGDRARELAALRAQEPVVTDLAKALLAELR